MHHAPQVTGLDRVEPMHSTPRIRQAYLDYNATAPLRPEARAALLDVLEAPSNASSVHAEGRAARARIERARAAVAQLIHAVPAGVTFVSGGTEANMMALTPDYQIDGEAIRLARLFVSAVEHPSVLAGGRFQASEVTVLPVDENGRVVPEELSAILDADVPDGSRFLVSVMLANNETGVLQPIAEIAEIVSNRGGLLHVDAVQAVGRIAVDMAALGADLLSLSGHKIGAPPGVGALVRRREGVRPAPVLTGGGQESRLRSGTENAAAIAGLGAVVESILEDRTLLPGMTELRDRLETGLLDIAADTVIFGRDVPRIPNTVCFAVPGIQAETALISLDLAGISVSSGSACSSGKVAASHVLAAIGVEPVLAGAALRISMGWATIPEDIDRFLEVWVRVVDRIRRKSGK